MHPFASDFGLKFARQVHFRTETPYISSISDFAMGMQTSSITRPVSSAGDIRLYGKVSAARFPDSTGPPADILHRSYLAKRAISGFIAYCALCRRFSRITKNAPVVKDIFGFFQEIWNLILYRLANISRKWVWLIFRTTTIPVF